jgi:hypothetical protein
MAKVIRPFPTPTDGSPQPCYVYVVGYPHAKYGHAIKVGMSIYPTVRLSNMQTGNPDEIQTYLLLRFERQAMAREVEFQFHETKLGNPIRGEWVGCDPMEAIHYLTFVTAIAFARKYRDPEIRRHIRRESGLIAACEALDRMPGYDVAQGIYNQRWGLMEGARAEYASR